MRHLRTTKHPQLAQLNQDSVIIRKSSRAIVIKDREILLLYTGRYDDFSLPGGGVYDHESWEQGLVRELNEETGAVDITIESEFGIYEEFRPWYKKDFDIQHIISYCYVCSIGPTLESPKLEENEIRNGSEPMWMNIDNAIAHNEKAVNASQAGMSIHRELFLLKLIKDELIDK